MSPDLLFWYALALKMALTATVVVVTSVAVERSGPFVGAVIGALPTAAGSAYTILALTQPPDFIAASAVGSIAINGAVAIFAVTYTILAQRRGLFVSLGTAISLWLIVAALLRTVNWTPLTAVGFNAVLYAITLPLSRRYRADTGPAKFVRTWLDIPLRAITVATLVAVVTTFSSRIGSFASGMFAVFPIILGSSIVIMHPRIGGKATASMLAHTQPFLIGLSWGFLAVHYLVAPIGVWPALTVGLVVSLAWSGALVAIRKGMQRRAATSASSASP